MRRSPRPRGVFSRIRPTAAAVVDRVAPRVEGLRSSTRPERMFGRRGDAELLFIIGPTYRRSGDALIRATPSPTGGGLTDCPPVGNGDRRV